MATINHHRRIHRYSNRRIRKHWGIQASNMIRGLKHLSDDELQAALDKTWDRVLKMRDRNFPKIVGMKRTSNNTADLYLDMDVEQTPISVTISKSTKMQRFMGIMPVNEIGKEVKYKTPDGENIIVQAGPRGWTVVYGDGATDYKDVEAETDVNFEEAMTCLRKGFPESN